MAELAGWGDFGAAVWNLQKAKDDDKITDRGVIDRLAFAVLYEARGTRDALKQIHDRLERLHQKIDRIEKKLGSV